MLRARRFNSDGSAAIPSFNIIREDDPNPIDVDGIEVTPSDVLLTQDYKTNYHTSY